MRLDVNTDATIQLTAKLEKLHRSAFPSAVRNTLNQTAFLAKKEVPNQANKNFTVRQKNLFTRFVLVEKAKGFDVKNMSSRFGIDASTKSKLAEGLEKQEKGGIIKNRRVIAHDKARVSGSAKKKVRQANYLTKVANVSKKGRRTKSKYIMIKKGDKGTIFETKNGRLSPIYNIRNTDTSKVDKKPFMQPSAEMASKKMPEIYRKQAEFQFKKYMQ